MEKDTTIEGVMREFIKNECLVKDGVITIGSGNLKDFLRSALSAQKEEIENNIVKMKKTDLDLSPGFSITAEYRLGEIRGWNDAIESIISSITNNKEKK